jgi:hypothetical protein
MSLPGASRKVRAMAEMNDDDEQINICDPSGGVNIASVAKQDAGLANDLEWTYAFIALMRKPRGNPRPLAALLRSEKPISRGVRKSLAELLDPSELLIFDTTLKPMRRIGWTPHKLKFFGKRWSAVTRYDWLRQAGKSADDARAEVTKKYKWRCDESVFNRHRRRVHAYLAHFQRVREEITGKNSGK